MTIHEITDSSQDAWVPGIFGPFNITEVRAKNIKRWEGETVKRNATRPILKKVLHLGKVSVQDVMIDEAIKDNKGFDDAYPNNPDHLWLQRIAETMLKASGVQETHFNTVDELNDVLSQRSLTYNEIVDIALEAVGGVVRAK